MKKAVLIILSIIATILAVICLILTGLKVTEPVTPTQTEQTEQKQPPAIRPKVEVQAPSLMDENDMPKSDVKVPEIG